MKHLELHILQSVPVACLNRDDLNSPKTAVFGGVQRARVSSQCWKSAIRSLSKEYLPIMNGQRTRRLIAELSKRLVKGGLNKTIADQYASMAASQLSKIDNKKDEEGYLKVKTLCFLSSAEFDAISSVIIHNDELNARKTNLESLLNKEEPSDEEKKEIEKILKACKSQIDKKEIGKVIKNVKLKDAADIALFGRMVADDHSLTLEGAALFSHALSTHKVNNEIDFFSAVDDLQSTEAAGAGMTGTLEFNSATYYRFAALNLDMLADQDHLGALEREDRRKIVATFIRSTLLAIPKARRNSMNANTLPGFVMGIVREKGHPIQLVNAFENPVYRSSNSGIFDISRESLLSEYESLKKIWNLDEIERVEIPQDDLEHFIEKVISHVN